MQWRQISDEVALLQYPFGIFGIDFARNVTLIRIAGGRLVIHSTAPFSAEDVAAIRRFGEPGWLVEGTLMHDSFAREGRAAFPQIPYLAPIGFSEVSGVAVEPLSPSPNEWSGQLEVIPIEGTRKQEHAFFHRSSRTLILADLIFSFAGDSGWWARFFVRNVMRLPRLHGISVFFKMLIANQEAFRRSMNKVMELDFTRIIVAHRDPIEKDAKSILRQALIDRGMQV